MPAPCKNVNAVKHGGYLDLAKRRVDGRTKLGKEIIRIKRQIATDLGNTPSEAQRLLIERVVAKVALLRFQELAMLEGKTELNDRYIALSNSLRMDLMAIGLERKQRDYITLKDYVKQKEGNNG